MNSNTSLTDGQIVRISKNMAWLLRHAAVKEGLQMNSEGYVLVDDLLKHPKMKGVDFSLLRHIVETNNKQRFSIREMDGNRFEIRANQGHSQAVGEMIEDEALLAQVTEPELCVHATFGRNQKAIQAEGLKVMQRTHIHMSPIHLVNQMARPNADLLIHIDMAAALQDGIEFYRSANGVLLTRGTNGVLSPKYLSKFEKRT